MSADPDVVLRLEGLTKSYGDLLALDGLSLEVRRGEILGLLGPNGAGKTTTVNIVCGLLRSDAGRISAHGKAVHPEERRWKRSLGLCPQDIVVWEALTCLEQLEFVGRLYDLPRPLARRRALELLEAMGLVDRRDSLAKTLSGGMKRRLNIALALVHEPMLLILDEPQAGLDPQSRVLVREYVRSLASRTTVVLTTHDMDEADRLSDRVAIIDHGALLVLDTPKNLKAQVGAGDVLEIEVPGAAESQVALLLQDLPDSIRSLAYEQEALRLVGWDTLNAIPQVLEVLRAHGIAPGQMVIRRKTLEDVFIGLTGRGLRE